MKRFENKFVVVTGGANGIGYSTALLFAREGATVAVCDVDEKGLTRVAAEIEKLGRAAITRVVDVSKASQMAAFADEVHARTPAVDVLVNNAGVGLWGTFLDTSAEDWEWVISINLMGVVHASRAFVPKMVARRQGGHVVNVSSLEGITASKVMCAYGTTKFAVFGFSEALRDELIDFGIGVSTVCPGLTSTDIAKSARVRGAYVTDELKQQAETAFAKQGQSPDVTAQAILQSVLKNRSVVPVSPLAWGAYFLKRFSPTLTAKIGRGVQKRMHLR